MPDPINIREYLTEQVELLTALHAGETKPVDRAQYAAELATVQHQLDQLDHVTTPTQKAGE